MSPLTLVKDLRPGMRELSLEFIVLDIEPPSITKVLALSLHLATPLPPQEGCLQQGARNGSITQSPRPNLFHYSDEVDISRP